MSGGTRSSRQPAKRKRATRPQKPLGILRRIISASSRPGDRVLDFFAGSGTTAQAAFELKRQFVVVDQNPESIEVITSRLNALGVEYVLQVK